MSTVRVTKLEKAPEGYWQAHVSSNGTTLEVDTRHGSWLARAQLAPHVERWAMAREVMPTVAAELQSRLPAKERKTK